MDVDEAIEVVPFDPRWTELAYAELERLAAVLSAWHVALEHIGSTAVPGCAAKPIVDLLAGTGQDERASVAAAIAAAGYEHVGEAASGRIYLRRRGDGDFNVHVVECDSGLWSDNIALRDYLRANPAAREEYGLAKMRAAEAAPMLLAYSRAKEPVLSELLARARATPRDPR
jgi:GrpB-like predicted nucleotidyltransferase (UPF0157 family)